MNIQPTRRTFLRATAAAAATFGMIGEGNSVKEKFELIKSIGFEGVEVDAPGGIDKAEAIQASKDTGIVIHGCIDATHWKTRMSDPDAAVREQALQTLLAALQ